MSKPDVLLLLSASQITGWEGVRLQVQVFDKYHEKAPLGILVLEYILAMQCLTNDTALVQF